MKIAQNATATADLVTFPSLGMPMRSATDLRYSIKQPKGRCRPGNPHQPSFLPQTVTQGEATTDEMMLVYFAYMTYQPGDENILLDSTLLNTSLPFVPENQDVGSIRLFPNPAQDFVEIQFNLSEQANYRVSIIAQNGRIVQSYGDQKEALPGVRQEHLDISELPQGIYFVEVQTSGEVFLGRFVK